MFRGSSTRSGVDGAEILKSFREATLSCSEFSQTFPEIVLCNRITDLTGQQYLSKGRLLSLVEDFDERPAFFLSSDKQAVLNQVRTLLRSGTDRVYAKQGEFEAHGGRSVFVLQRTAGGYEVGLPLKNTGITLPSSQDIYWQERDGLKVGYGRWRGILGVVRGIIEKFPGKTIIEADYRSTHLNGAPWELRSFVQAHSGIPKITARAVKYGRNEMFTNVSLGGLGISSHQEFVERVIGSLSLDRSEVPWVLKDFYDGVDELVLRTYGVVTDYLRSIVSSYLPTFPLELVYPREIAFDTTGRFNQSTGVFDRILVEIQYPGFGGTEDLDEASQMAFVEAHARLMGDSWSAFRTALRSL